MSGIKNHFDNYIDMILSSGENNGDDSSLTFDDFDDMEDEKLNVCREIFSAEYDSETDDTSNHSWRDEYESDLDCDIDPSDYDTEEEYLEALDEANSNENISTVSSSMHSIRIDKQSNTNHDRVKIYNYCKVLIESSNKQSLYLSGKIDLDVGDQVVVPNGSDNADIVGTVIAVGKCFGYAFPCDINEIKPVIKLLSKSDIANKSTGTSKKDFSRDNIIYEDDYIKVSFIKWEYHDYLAGRARAGTFLFENKYDDRLCMYFKNISVEGFLNQEESMPTALSGKKKVIAEISFVFDKKVPEHFKTYNEVEFTLCYGRIKEGYSASSLIQKPLIESDIISIKV